MAFQDVEWEDDPDGIKELLTSNQAMDALTEVAAVVGQYVENAMPERTGRHQRAIVTGPADVVDGVPGAYVGSESSTWHLIEYGSVNNAPHRPFARGVQQAGLTFVDTRGGA